MGKKFSSFPELFEWKRNCPICSKELTYKLEFSTLPRTGNYKKNLTSKLEKYFEGMLLEDDNEKQISIEFKPSSKPIEIEELKLIMDFNRNKCLSNDFESATDLFDLKIYCIHDVIGNAYEAKGSFDVDIDIEESSIIHEENKLLLDFSSIRIDWDKYKIYNLHLEDEKPNGNVIKIINDYIINKTSFSLAESNLDGTFGNWKEKRINLVDDNFFKFHESEKIYSRLNSILLLK